MCVYVCLYVYLPIFALLRQQTCWKHICETRDTRRSFKCGRLAAKFRLSGWRRWLAASEQRRLRADLSLL